MLPLCICRIWWKLARLVWISRPNFTAFSQRGIVAH